MLSFIAILISIWSVNVTIKNNNFVYQEVAPAFRINTYVKNGKTIDEFVNVKGFVNNLTFKRYDEITLVMSHLNYVMQYHCKNELEEKVINNRWPYLSVCRDKLGERIMKKLQELKSNYDVEIHSMHSSTYYEIVYQDYKNELHKQTYSKNANNTLSLREVKSSEQNNNYPKMGSYNGYPIDLSDETIEKDAIRTLQRLEEWQEVNRIIKRSVN